MEIKEYKGILINPEAKTIEEIQIKEDVLKSLYEIIGCELVECIRLDNKNALWVDEEGFYNSAFGFDLIGYSPLSGKGVILGYDHNGDKSDTTLSIETVTTKIKFH